MALSKKWILNLQSPDLGKASEKVFAKNMSALQAKDISLYQKIVTLPNDPSYELYRQKPKDLYNLVQKDHNSSAIEPYYDPENILENIEETLNKSDPRAKRLIILCGIGLGYELLAFMNLYDRKIFTKAILVIEKDPQIFKKCLEATDISDLIANPNISFMVGNNPSDFQAAFHDYIFPYEMVTLLKSLCVIAPDPAIKINSSYYVDIIKIIKSTAVYMMLFFGNCPEDSLIGERHMFRNISSILEHPGINLLYGKFSGKPAIVCASGPSLTKELPLLKSLQDQVLILSAESTFWPLADHGIHPHIMCTLERVVRPTGYFDKFSFDELKDTYLAVVPVVPPYMYESYLGPKINVYRNYNHFRWLPFDKGALDIKQSSANMAFKLAHMLGCSPIILLGQDLCFDRDTHLTHVQGHHFGVDQAQYHDEAPIEIPANDGQTTQTSPIWLEFLKGYVVDVRAYGGDVINCSAQGAFIEGTRCLPFKEAVAQYLQEPYAPLPLIREALASFTGTSIARDVTLLKDKIDITLTDLADLTELCAEGIRVSEDCAALFPEALSQADTELTISAQDRKHLYNAYNTINSFRNQLFDSYTYKMIVLHVVQSFSIAFEMNLNEDYASLSSEDSMVLHSVIRFREYFEVHSAMIDLVKKEIETAREITAAILVADQEGKSD
ncbi:MAG: DUF115 domain-containing protein [Peptococcaceae bacterium]|nr:DUF115 domain-containing protein [Peptococcaceae bacterium]